MSGLEPLGLAVALVGLFNDVIDIFNLVQIGSNYGRDSKTCALKLVHVQDRISRWGKAVGLSDLEAKDLKLEDLSKLAFSTEDMPKVEATLEHIKVLMEGAEAASRELGIDDKEAAFSADMSSITKGLSRISMGRRNAFKRAKKRVAWAIHGRDDARWLLDELQSLVNGLEDYSPTVKETDLVLAKAEVNELALAIEDLLALQKFLKDDFVVRDLSLRDVVNNEVQRLGGNTNIHNAHFGQGNTGNQVGHISGGGTYTFTNTR